ncbi:MAG: hypothetical protein KJ945_07250 [Gammaproteobacteria bacterium]|nr:hypothetical protein [Gammaproteobacteria bacterium]MBU0837112.1 hypothetical protein [Gammaproteobacteria bacterium]MBU1807024.1 hypothetical protein [Gammaproteobacteria bacterium]
MRGRVGLVNLAGLDFDPLLSDIDQLESRLFDLAEGADLGESIKESLDLMNVAAVFWLDEKGDYPAEARTVCAKVHHNFDAIFQQVEFEGVDALASSIRYALWEHDATDSRLASAYAIALIIEGLQPLCDWLIELRGESLMIVTDSTSDNSSNQELARQRLFQEEMRARLAHADLLASAKQVLFLAGLYKQAEDLSHKAEGYRVAKLLRNAISAAAGSARASAAGRGNSRPDSLRKQAEEDLRERIRLEALRIMKGRPGINRKHLISVLFSQKLATRPTLKRHLDKLGLPPNEL